MILRYQATQVLPSVYLMSCGLGGALSNLTLFPRSTFVTIKLSRAEAGLCPADGSPRRDSWCFSQTPGKELTPPSGYRRGHYPLDEVLGHLLPPAPSRGLQLALSHHQPEFQPFSFGDAPSLAALLGTSQPRSSSSTCAARCTQLNPPSAFRFWTPSAVLGSITFSRGGKSLGPLLLLPAENGALSCLSQPGLLPAGCGAQQGRPKGHV